MRAGQVNNPNTQNGSAPRVVESQRWAVSQCGSFYCLLDGQVFCFLFPKTKTTTTKPLVLILWEGKGPLLFRPGCSLICPAIDGGCPASSIARQLASHLPLSSKAKLPPRSCFSYIPTVVLRKWSQVPGCLSSFCLKWHSFFFARGTPQARFISSEWGV